MAGNETAPDALQEQSSGVEAGVESRAQERDADTAADVKAIVVLFFTAIVMAIHFVSGFTFDF
ncbi:MAG: hypothetical protein AAF541_15980 [Pseudomonadota bacterium]